MEFHNAEPLVGSSEPAGLIDDDEQDDEQERRVKGKKRRKIVGGIKEVEPELGAVG